MKQIQATITDQNLNLQQSVISVANSVNAYQLVITYDSEWNDVDRKIITFSSGNGTNIAVEDQGEGVIIPWEVLRFQGPCAGEVYVGAIGYQGTVAKITTTGLYKTNTLLVLPEVAGMTTAMTPTPDIFQRLLQTINQINGRIDATDEEIQRNVTELTGMIGDLDDLDTEAKDNLVAAINELAQGGGGSGTVKSVNNVEPDAEGNVTLTPDSIGAQANITIDGTTLNI